MPVTITQPQPQTIIHVFRLRCYTTMTLMEMVMEPKMDGGGHQVYSARSQQALGLQIMMIAMISTLS